MPLLNPQARCFRAVIDELCNPHGAELQFHAVRLDLGELEQVVGEPRQAPGVVTDDFEEAAAVLLVVNRPAEQSLGKALDGSQRSSQLMRSEEHTSELQSRGHLVCRLLLEKKKNSPFCRRVR